MNMRYFIGFVATVGLIILLIILIFHGGGSKPKVPVTQKTLASYATTDASAVMIADGPIGADQNHEQVQIIVSNSDATFEHIKGYQGNVVKTQNYANNTAAFTNFLFALDRAGFTNGSNASALKDERGFCPLGDRYIFSLRQGGQTLERYWATTCGGTRTYLGSFDLTRELFQNQIPNYSTLIQDVTL